VIAHVTGTKNGTNRTVPCCLEGGETEPGGVDGATQSDASQWSGESQRAMPSSVPRGAKHGEVPVFSPLPAPEDLGAEQRRQAASLPDVPPARPGDINTFADLSRNESREKFEVPRNDDEKERRKRYADLLVDVARRQTLLPSDLIFRNSRWDTTRANGSSNINAHTCKHTKVQNYGVGLVCIITDRDGVSLSWTLQESTAPVNQPNPTRCAWLSTSALRRERCPTR